MIFSSLLFLFRFLPAVLLLYYIVPVPARNLVLLIMSLIFYAWGEPVYILLMLVSILISYAGGFFVDFFLARGRDRSAMAALVISTAAGLGLLGFFKYADFLIGSVNAVAGTHIALFRVALPIGISFYTFQTISYIIDVYRGNARVQKNIISYGAYVTMFPQLIAGPIVQYKTIDRQLRERRETAEEFAEGVNRFMIGLGKKVLLANNAGLLWDRIRVLPADRIPALSAWLGLAAFTFQIYFDFSGYSDMAIGLGHMFGFRFLENFNYPYMSRSVTEFWRRWHISLGTWFREYVYIPLGGNRVRKTRFIRNILIVWMLTGIWHGANWNFLIWGLFYGCILLGEKMLYGEKLQGAPAAVQHIYTMFIVMIGWFIFSLPDISCGPAYFLTLFGRAGLVGGESIYLLVTNAVLLLFLIIGSLDLPSRAAGMILARFEGHDWICILLRGAFYIFIFVLSVAFLVDASYNPFLYFRF